MKESGLHGDCVPAVASRTRSALAACRSHTAAAHLLLAPSAAAHHRRNSPKSTWRVAVSAHPGVAAKLSDGSIVGEMGGRGSDGN